MPPPPPDYVRAVILEKLLRDCESTDAALVTRQSLPPAKGPLPEPLGQFLDEYIARPSEHAPAEVVMRAVMADFGVRLFRQLLAAGRNRRDCDTDEEQDSQDALAAADLLKALAVECQNTPFVPLATAQLLARTANGLREGAGRECEGNLAAVLQILVRGDMKPAAAQAWLGGEVRSAGLVDAAGNQISGKRLAEWRNSFGSRKIGARRARASYEMALAWPGIAGLLAGPNDARKLAACQDHARRIIRFLAIHFNRTVAPPLRRPKRLKDEGA
jgi:hypothetical protein